MSSDPVFDCRACGACCHGATDGRILVTASDLVRWKRDPRLAYVLEGLVEGHFGERAFPCDEAGACLHLGTPESPNDCSIYETRADSCRALEPGSGQCRSYRRDRGIVDPA